MPETGEDEGQADSGNDSDTQLQRVKKTLHVEVLHDESGRKMINEYVRERVIGSGSYAKVALHRSTVDGKLYAIKICVKSRLSRVKVGPGRTALMDVHQEIDILERLHYLNVIQLIEVIDDPESDKLYLVLEHMDGGALFEGSGPAGGIGETNAKHVFIQVLCGLTYLHDQGVVHGDLKGENILLSAPLSDRSPSFCIAKISDFGVSHVFQGDDDWMRRSPGTPVFSSPESCSGQPYRGRLQDTWALGCLLYIMVTGQYPFRGDTLASTYDKIMKQPLKLPDSLTAPLRNLLTKLLAKDPTNRLSLDQAKKHPWVENNSSYGSPRKSTFSKISKYLSPSSTS